MLVKTPNQSQGIKVFSAARIPEDSLQQKHRFS